MRTLIIGNSGSGKTFLARRFAVSTPIIHLDDIFWEPEGFNKQREPQVVEKLIKKSKKTASWTAEGVFGHLAQSYLQEADQLIWLELPLEICLERLKKRGSEAVRVKNR